MKKILIALGLILAYAVTMVLGYYTTVKRTPEFPIPEYVEVSYPTEKISSFSIYQDGSKYYADFDDKYELTYEEYIRCACINPDNFDIDEDNRMLDNVYITVEIKYPDKKAKKYDIYSGTSTKCPCWQLMCLKAEKEHGASVLTGLNEVFDEYRVKKAYCSINIPDGIPFLFYGDCAEEMYGLEDCMDEDVYLDLMAEIVLRDLIEKHKMTSQDLTDDPEEMRDLIEDLTGKNVISYINSEFASPSLPLYSKERKIRNMDFTSYLMSLSVNTYIGRESRLNLLDEKFTYTDDYKYNGYYRVIEDDGKILILCISPDYDIYTSIVIETEDELTRQALIDSVIETVFDMKDHGPEDHPYETMHFKTKAIVITIVYSVLFVLMIVVFVVLHAAGKKGKAETAQPDQIVN